MLLGKKPREVNPTYCKQQISNRRSHTNSSLQSGETSTYRTYSMSKLLQAAQIPSSHSSNSSKPTFSGLGTCPSLRSSQDISSVQTDLLTCLSVRISTTRTSSSSSSTVIFSNISTCSVCVSETTIE